MSQDIIIKAEQVNYSYEDTKSHALKNLSLEIKKGQKVAVMGANGSGKSTFFLCCNGIHKPTSGTIYFDGKQIDYSRKGLLQLRKEVGIVFQDPDNQLFSASVYQEISFGILNTGVTEIEAKKEVERVIDQLEITPFREKPTHALSGGEKKQVSIADILVMKPQVIILDEPHASLDPKHSEKVNQIIDQLTEEGITVIMAMHDVDYAYAWADQVLLFHQGSLLKSGTPTEVFADTELLRQTNLVQPAVIQVFEYMKQKGMFDMTTKQPKSIEELIKLK